MMKSAFSDGLFTRYKTLREGEIRLLHLKPPIVLESSQLGTPTLAEIECLFSLTHLDNPVPFEALSYTWGDQHAQLPVKIDGELVNITKNLSLALLYLRRDDGPRTLWVDALCINQVDIDERNRQVAAMRWVYERATNVVIFLGEAWDGHEIAIEYLERASQSDEHYDPSLTPHITVRGYDTDSDKLREEVIHFFMLPWWDRTWVIQEYVLAKSVIFQLGNTLMAGHVIQQAFHSLAKHYWMCCGGNLAVTIPSPTYGLSLQNALRRINAIDLARSYQYDMNMLQMLAMFRMRKSTDARDKICGMLGMHFVPEIETIVPDYQISAERLYIVFATRHIAQTGTLDVLSHAGYLNQGGLDVPSYVPDWTAPMTGHEHRHYATRGNAIRLYNASGGRVAQSKVLDDGRILLNGVFVDKIAVTGSVHDTEMNALALLRECLQLMGEALAGRQARAQSESESEIAHHDPLKQEPTETPLNGPDERLRRTLCGNISAALVGNRPPPLLQIAEPEKNVADYRAWWTWITEKQPLGLPPSADATTFQQGLQFNATARKFAVMDSGSIGFVPASSEKGDVIALLYGGKTPFVLRATSKSSGVETCYTLIGDSYIDGIMHGEAVETLVGNIEVEFLIS